MVCCVSGKHNTMPFKVGEINKSKEGTEYMLSFQQTSFFNVLIQGGTLLAEGRREICLYFKLAAAN